MTDPVKNVEIEDVLSSIRRLVSEDVRPKSSPPSAAPDRLVLTPAQRVAEEPEYRAEEDDVERNDTTGTAPVLLTDRLDTESATDRQEPGRDAARTGEEGSDDDAVDALSLLVGQEVEQALRAFKAAEARDADAAQDAVEELESEEPEAAAEDTDAAADDLSGAEDSPTDPAPEARVEDQRKASTLEQKVAELEALIAGSDEDWEPEPEPDQDGASHFLGDRAEALAWQDYDGDTEEVEAAPDLTFFQSHRSRPRDEQTTHDAAAEAETEPSDGGTAVIDEDMLRDIVAEIVRQELQGALGERITRNVRKLVRREIHRALISQNLE